MSKQTKSPLSAVIVAHRGASDIAPENTLAAVVLGYAQGADAVEIDVQLSLDRQLVVIHDKDTRRTAGGISLAVATSTYANLRQLEVGSWKGVEYIGEKIPLLEEVLALVPAGKKLVIELKAGPECLPYLQQVIIGCGIPDQLVFISFNQAIITLIKQAFPKIPAFWLLQSWANVRMEAAIRIAREAQLNGLNVQYKLADEDFMHRMQNQGLEVYVYTVNNASIARRMLALGVQGITTDRPKWLRDKLQNSQLSF